MSETIVVFGGTGQLGSQVVKVFREAGYHVVAPTRYEVDLYDAQKVSYFLAGMPENFSVINCAGVVRGIGGQDHAMMLADNMAMGTNVCHAANRLGAKYHLYASSSCVYPPSDKLLNEGSLMGNSMPSFDDSNRGYAFAKYAVMRLCFEFNLSKDIHTKNITFVPPNLFSSEINLNEKFPHVIPDVIRKFKNAKKDEVVNLRGTGFVYREFLHVEDCARMILRLYECASNINTNTTVYNIPGYEETLIFDVIRAISKEFNDHPFTFSGNPNEDGPRRKCMDQSRIFSLKGFYTSYSHNLYNTIPRLCRKAKEVMV